MGKYLVSIAGNIGVGKTTLTQMLGDRLGWKTFYEQVIDNPYLADFYADMRRWSFSLQVYFFTHRFQLLQQMLAEPVSCVQDRTIYEDVEIFARTLNRQGFLDDRDYGNYRALFETMIRFLPPPNLIIYRRASPEFLLERIRSRGRGFEQGISLEYLRGLHQAYDEWIARAAVTIPVLTLDAETCDLYRPADVEQVLARVRECCPEC
jgi:deoxyadenosine/deoxycytidine kinase